MGKIIDEGFLFLYGTGLLMMVDTGTFAVMVFLIACIYTCGNLIWKNKYLHYLMTVGIMIAGILCQEIWMFFPICLYNMLYFCSPVYIGIGGIVSVGVLFRYVEYYGVEKTFLIAVGMTAAILLQNRTERLKELEWKYKKSRDDSKELTMMLEKKNRDLLEKQDTEVYMATLKERNRIAREIHDNVGHMLSRSILVVGALKAMNQDEQLKKMMEQLDQTLNEAMTSVRKSVHDLHDESVNLKEVMESLAEEFTFCPVHLTYDMGYDIPKEIKYSFIAITKEALNNVMRHSNADEVRIVVREHPWLYQLIVEDNGTKEQMTSDETDENIENRGIGIKNMKERIRMLHGTMQVQKKNGFRIFITVPKQNI